MIILVARKWHWQQTEILYFVHLYTKGWSLSYLSHIVGPGVTELVAVDIALPHADVHVDEDAAEEHPEQEGGCHAGCLGVQSAERKREGTKRGLSYCIEEREESSRA